MKMIGWLIMLFSLAVVISLAGAKLASHLPTLEDQFGLVVVIGASVIGGAFAHQCATELVED